MTTINLQFEIKPGGKPARAAAELQKKLAALPQVASAKTESLGDVRFSLAEAVTVVTAVITVVKHGHEAVTLIRSLVKNVREFLGEVKDLKGCFIEIGAKKVAVADLEKMTDAEIEEM